MAVEHVKAGTMNDKLVSQAAKADQANGATEVMQLYGVGDLAAALKVPHGYVTPLLNRGVFCHTHQWGNFRLFTRDRLDQIVREHGALIRAESLLPNQFSMVSGDQSNLEESTQVEA